MNVNSSKDGTRDVQTKKQTNKHTHSKTFRFKHGHNLTTISIEKTINVRLEKKYFCNDFNLTMPDWHINLVCMKCLNQL